MSLLENIKLHMWLTYFFFWIAVVQTKRQQTRSLKGQLVTRLCRPHGLFCLLNSALIVQKGQSYCINEWVWLCYEKTLFIDTDIWMIVLMCPKTSLFFWLPPSFEKWKNHS